MITNKVQGLIQKKAEIDAIVEELSDPITKDQINDLPINPFLKEVLIKMLDLILDSR